MKKQKIIVIIIAITLLIAIGAVFAIFSIHTTTNKRNLKELMSEFTMIINEVCTENIIESKSVYGKLNGNGNGIQYFGVVLVNKGSIPDINALISKLANKFDVVEWWAQENSDINTRHLEHQKLKYDTNITAKDGYISICFCTSHSNSNIFDIEGH